MIRVAAFICGATPYIGGTRQNYLCRGGGWGTFILTTSYHQQSREYHWPRFTIVMVRLGCQTSGRTEVFPKSVLGQVKQSIIDDEWGWGRRSVFHDDG